jgi:hypothetical protein
MLGLFFDSQTFATRFGNSLGNIELDAALEETHEWVAEATSNPVEEGAPVTDHVIEQADKIRINGFVSNSPVTSSFSFGAFGSSNGRVSKSQEVFDLLHELIKMKEPVTVYTRYRLYENMILTNVSIPRTAGVGEAIEFSAEFIHIRMVATQVVDVPKGISAKKAAKTPAAVGNKAEPLKDGGKKQVETVVPPVNKPSSTLSRLFS